MSNKFVLIFSANTLNPFYCRGKVDIVNARDSFLRYNGNGQVIYKRL